MVTNNPTTRRGVVAVASASIIVMFVAQAREGNTGDKGQRPEPATVVGCWTATERHAAHGSLYQPIHTARKREALVYFERDGDRLTGRSETPDYKEITGQGDWDGGTKFDRVRFTDGKLVFEIDITDWNPKLAPLSRGLTAKTHKGTTRVEAKLDGDKLVGKWGIFARDGTEVFRGEWEAVRAKEDDKK